MNEKINLNQLWADEMNGKVPGGTYRKEWKKQYPSTETDEKIKKIEGWWKKEFQYLLDRKILSRDELGYLFGQIKSIIEQENKVLLSHIKELEEGIHLLINFIPDGWEVPLGWTVVVSQARKLIKKEKL